MAQTYTRQSSFSDGDTITAALFNDEYNQLVNAFSYSSSDASSTGHRHDGTAGQGGNIHTIGDLDFLNKIVVDSTNNRWGVYVEVSGSAVEQIRIQDGAIVPVTDNDIDLGTSSLEFKDLYLDGTATIDTLTVDANATIAGTLGVTGATTLSSTLGVTGAATLSSTLAVTGTTTLTGNVTTTNDLSVGGNLTVTGTTTFNGGTITMGDAATDNVVFGADVDSHIIPDDDDTYDLGSTTQQWRNLYIDGTAEIDTLSLNGTAVTSTAAELNILDGVTSTAAELNILDGVTATAAELNILDGVTSTAAELNILDGVTSTAAELNLLDGVTATTAELNYLDVTTLGTVEASKAVTADANADVLFGDSDKLVFGAGSDLQIYHDGSNSFIRDSGTGDLQIRASNLLLTDVDGTIMLDGRDNGKVSIHYNGAEKLTTTSTGIDVTGVITTDGMTTSADINFGDNDKAVFGAGSDLQIYHDPNHSIINESGTGSLKIQGDNIRLQKTDGSENMITAVNDGAVTLFYDNAEKLATTATGIDVTGTVTADGLTVDGDITVNDASPSISFFDTDGTNQRGQVRQVSDRIIVSARNNTAYGSIYFTGQDASTEINRMTIDGPTGDISFYEDTGTTAKLFWDASAESLGIGTSSPASELHVKSSGTSSDTLTIENSTGNGSWRVKEGGSSNALLQGYNASNSETIRLDPTSDTFFNNGNVGIGTSSPAAPMSIAGSSTGEFDALILRNGNAAASGQSTALIFETSAGTSGDEASSVAKISGLRTGAGSKGDLLFHTTLAGVSSEAMRIDSSGDMIIKGGRIFVRENDDGNDAVVITRDADEGYVNLYSSGSQTVEIRGNGDSYFNGGNVGIGTSSPSSFYTHAQNLVVGSGSGGEGLTIYSGSSDSGYIGFNDTASNGMQGFIQYNHNGDYMAFAPNGTEKVRIDSSGLVGIGTSSPATRLHVYQATGNTALRVESAAANSQAQINFKNDARRYNVGINSSDNFVVEDDTASVTRMTIDSSGNVGINSATPSERFEIAESANETPAAMSFLSEDTSIAGTQEIGVIYAKGKDSGTESTGAKITFAADGTWDTGTNYYYPTAIKFYTQEASGTDNIAAGPRMTIDSSGQVEITGTADAETGLTTTHTRSGVGYTLILDNLTNATNNGSGIKWRSGGFDTGAIITRSDSTAASSDAPAFMTFHTSDDGTENLAERMRIDSSGNVGIGLSSGIASKLHVNTEMSLGADADNRGIVGYTPSRFYIGTRQGGTNYFDTLNVSGGLVGIGTTSPDGIFHVKSASSVHRSRFESGSSHSFVRIIGNTGSNAGLEFYSGSGNVGNITADSTSNLLFEPGGTEQMRIDSSGRVLIGTSSTRATLGGDRQFQIEGLSGVTSSMSITRNSNGTDGPNIVLTKTRGTADGQNTIVVSGDDLGTLAFVGADGTDTAHAAASIKAQIDGTPGADDLPGRLVFSTTADGANSVTERMRLNASGDWMVSNTVANVASGYSTQGGVGWVDSDLHLEIATTNDRSALEIGRNHVNDGELVTFRKQSTPVGTIGVLNANNLTVGGSVASHGGIQFGTENVTPMVAGSEADAGADLGAHNLRWRNLYLSGGLYVGGTGAANYLDDYEEGTFTPTVVGSTTAGTATYAFQTGRYTKVGNLVTVQIYLNWSSGTGAGVLQFDGLPFTTKNATAEYGNATIGEFSNITGTAGHMMGGVGLPNNTKIQFTENDFSSAPTTVSYDAAGYIVCSMTYIAD